MAEKSTDAHTATDIEPYFLEAIRDGNAHRIREVYESVERSGVLSGEDYSRIPTTAGYKRLVKLGVNIKQHSASARSVDALVATYDLPFELHYRNRIRYARRQLLRKEHIIAPAADLVQITQSGQERLAIAFKEHNTQSAPRYLPMLYLEPTEGNAHADNGPTTALQAIRVRRGQTRFRHLLRSRYGNRCAMSGETLLDVLEAAHIRAVADGGLHAADNGLLLRADLHTLFDLDLVGIHPADLSIHLHESLHGTGYEILLADQCLQIQNDIAPNRDALGHRWARFLHRSKPDQEAG
jgi:hypothetical protein